MTVVTIRGRALVAWVGLMAAACAAIRTNAQAVDGDSGVQSVAVAWGKGYLYETESAILLDETIVVCGEGATRLWCLNKTTVDSASDGTLDPKAAEDLKRDFLARNRAVSRVPPVPPLRHASGAEVRKAFLAGGFKDLQRLYPRLQHIVKVTAPAYTSDRRTALIYVQVTCAGRCGGYSLLLLERRDQRWIVVKPLASRIG